MARLPTPGGDANNWGEILNNYLAVSHSSDGTLKPGAVSISQIVNNAITSSKIANASVTLPKLSVTNTPVTGHLLSYDGSGLAWIAAPSGITDHGLLSGLGDDDHVQYHTDARGDTRYYTKSQIDSSLTTKANLAHTHVQSDVTNLTSDLANKEPTVSTATAGDYYRGDKTWQSLDRSSVGLADVDNTSDATKNSATATLTNKTIDGNDNTLQNIAQASVTNLTNNLAAKADTLTSINAQVGTTYTLASGDVNMLITLTNAAAVTLTVPTDASVAFDVGTVIKLAQMGAGQVTVEAASGVAVFGDPGLNIAAQYGGAELIKTATNTWLLMGRLAA